MTTVEFWFEFASTYSYPAAMRVAKVAKAAGVDLVWRPFLLGPVFAGQGLTDSPFNVFEQKGRYMWRDVARLCEADGLSFKKPSTFPQNALKAERIALIGLDEGWGEEFARRVYVANFVEGALISEDDVLARLLEEVGQDVSAITARAYAQSNKDRLKAQTMRAVELGIFGAPSFTVGEELFWGNDRMEAAFSWAQRSSS